MYTLSNVRITQNGIVYLVPCELLPYLTEIYALIENNTVANVFLEVAENHNIVLFKKEPLKTVRRQPPANPIAVRANQPVDYFILTTFGSNLDLIDVTNYIPFTDDAKYISTFNVNEIKMKYTRMEKRTALYTLFRGVFPKAAICTSINNTTLRDFTGIIYIDRTDHFVFVPYIHPKLRYLYTPYSDYTNVYFKQIGCTLDQLSSSLLYKYTGVATL